jgi:glycosyltransferase involved in cell wall biosynthesis
MDLVFVGDRCCDHSPSSGYDQICSIFPDAGWLSGRELEAGRLTWYRKPARQVESRPQIFHVFYGDCSGSRLPVLLRAQFPDARIVATVHQPLSRLQHDSAGWSSLFSVDAILTVSEIQARQLAHVGLTAPARALPHGVWTHVFAAASEAAPARRTTVLLVGTYHRDWLAAQQVIEILSRAGVETLVLGSSALEHLVLAGTLGEILPRVSEPELARLYDQAAALLLLPKDATASNALLEAMAAGCPVICPRFPSLVNDYLGDSSDSFEYGDYQTAVARILEYIRNPDVRRSRSRALVRRAKHFDWSHLQPQYEAYYDEVLSWAYSPADRESLPPEPQPTMNSPTTGSASSAVPHRRMSSSSGMPPPSAHAPSSRHSATR